MNDYDKAANIAEILFQYVILERSKDWLAREIKTKIEQIDIAESAYKDEEAEVLRANLKCLYYRCSFENRSMDRFLEKYGHAIQEPTGVC